MDKLQVLALCLEITGFGLAFLHIYKRRFSDIVYEKIISFISYLGLYGIDYSMPGADDDESIPLEARKYIPFNNFLILTMFILFTYVLIIKIDYGDGFFLNF